MQPFPEHVDICSNHEECEARRGQIKMKKGFVAKEPVKGHMASLFLHYCYLLCCEDKIFCGDNKPVICTIKTTSVFTIVYYGCQVNVVRGVKLYEDIFTDVELSKLTDFVNELRVAGQDGELSGGSCDL